MEDLRNVYLEEAEDLLSKMEESLLLLEKSPDDASLIAEIFRAMHTLKGCSSMYGSFKVADFVHNLEAMYDKVRSEDLYLSQNIMDVTFNSLDHLRKIIHEDEITHPAEDKRHQELTRKILELQKEIGKDHKKEVRPAKKYTYHIFFAPKEDVFNDGTNPLLLIDELNDLGKAKIYCSFNPKIETEKFDPKKCYAVWDIILAAGHDKSQIRDVFIFVEDSKIIINKLADGDLFTIPKFTRALPVKDYSSGALEINELKEIAASISSEELKNRTEEAAAPTSSPKSEDDSPETTRLSSSHSDMITGIRVSADKLDELMNQVSELVTTQAGLLLYTEKKADPALKVISDNIEKVSRQLRDISFEMTLIQISNLFRKFNRVIRDVSVQLGKSVKFITEGGETGLDKKIIDSLTDPLMHLIRNSLDHGIEMPEQRIKKGKNERGIIKLSSYYSGAKVCIQIEDDGQGMDLEKIRAKAVKNRLINADDNLSDEEILDLIFIPGFSMAEEVTGLSGRGVGMDVVKKNIMDIRGDISIESTPGRGTTIKLSLPLTLSVIDGLLVQVKTTSYIVPLNDIEKCYEIHRSELSNDFDGLLMLDHMKVPFLDLRKEFGIDDADPAEKTSVILLANENRKIAVCADTIIGEYQAVLKPVGKYYRHQDFISGATILGDGSIALVLDAYKIVDRKIMKQRKSA